MRLERKWLMATAASLVAVVGLGASPAFAHLPVGEKSRAMPVSLNGSPSVAPYAVCPKGPTTVGPTNQRVAGVKVSGERGSCAGTSAQVSVDSAILLDIARQEITSISGMCDKASHTATTSAVWQGQTYTTPTTIVFHAYTLVFNETSPLGLTAVMIVTPRGDHVRVGTVACKH